MNERKWKKIILVTIVLSAMVISGFSVLTGNAKAAPVNTKSSGDLVVAFQQDIPNLNIFDPATNTVWKFDALGWSFETLFSYTPDLIVYPVIGETATPDATGLNVTVTLKHNVTFQDGTPLKAEDVVFSYQTLYWDSLFTTSLRCLYWSTPQWPLWNGTGHSHIGVVALDDYTVVFHLSQPYPLFYQITLNNYIIPEHIWINHIVSAGTGDSDDMTLDMSWVNDPAATIGTGELKFLEWQPGNYVKIGVYTDYWGKGMSTQWNGKNWPWYPKYVKTITFKIYNTLDTAVLALKKGEVHYIDWSIPPGYYNQLKTDPDIGTTIVDDQGYFYLAFNMRKKPMNDLNFRTAVAHAIDKDYIVTTLMQGYGTKGTVPISITSGAYVNTSAIPPDFDLNAANSVLDNAGYTVGSDGWRHSPDGSPIKDTILTPPKDYDPIRAEAGLMIQANLQKLQLNIQSSPTDFDTIVSKAFVQVQYDMYILGWAVGSFPETYLEDFFASWNAAPVGYNTPGYSNPKVDNLLIKIRTEMDTAKRIQEVKDVEGYLVHDLPYDTLYYRKNIMSYRQDIWQGWVSAYGTIWNGFSINTIGPAVPPPPPPTHGGTTSEIVNGTAFTGVVPHMYVPDSAYAGESINGLFYVTDANGLPISGVNVTIYSSTGVYANGTTGDSGGFKFSVPLKFQEYDTPVTLTYWVNAYLNGRYYNYTGSKDVDVYLPKNVVKVGLTMDKNVLTPGESAIVTASVTDLYGNPLSNVNVTILTQETLGTIEPYNYTDSNGTAIFHYTAPTNVPNINAVDIVKATVNINDTILTNLQTAALFIPIESQGSSWYKVEITGVSSYGITAGNSSDITVKVVDFNGNPVASHDVYVAAYFSNATDPNWYGEQLVPAWGVTWDATHKTTDSNGVATFTLTATENADIPVIVVASTQDTYTASDSVEIYVGNNTGFDPYLGPWVDMWGMDMQLNKVSTTYGQQVDVTVTLYNATTGAPENNTFVFMAVFGTDYGMGADWANNAGIYVGWAGQSLIYGVTDNNGQFTYTLNTSALRADEPIYVSAWPHMFHHYDPNPFNVSVWAGLGFNYPYLFGVKDAFILQRAPIMGISQMSVSDIYLNSTINKTQMTVTVVDPNGPLSNVNLDISWSVGSYSNSTTAVTGSDGTASFNITVEPQIADSLVDVSILLSSTDHAMNLNYEYYIPYLANTETLTNLRVLSSIEIGNEQVSLVPYNKTANITLQLVGGLQGKPLANEEVSIFVPAGTVNSNTLMTDENGTVTFEYIAPDIMLPAHYLFSVTPSNGVPYYFGVEVDGRYANTAAIAQQINNESQQISNLTSHLNTLQTEYNTLQSSYNALQQNNTNLLNANKNLKNEKDTATMLEYTFLALFIIMIIVAILLYYAGKKKAAPAVPEEETAEEAPEEEVTEEAPEEEAPEEEVSEEPSEEETPTE